MKYLNGFIVFLILFTGCAQQQSDLVEVDIQKYKEQKEASETPQKVTVIEKDILEDEDIYKEVEEETTPIKQYSISKDTFKVAVIFPSQVVGKYAIDGVNTIMSYMLYKNKKFDLITYDCINESEQTIEEVVDNIDFNQYNNIVLFMTSDGLSKFLNLRGVDNTTIYVPLINKEDYNGETPSNVVFGGIDYNKQFEVLYTLTKENIAEFHDSISLGQSLSLKLEHFNIDYKFQKRLNRKDVNYEGFLKENTLLKDTSIFLNTPIVQTSILLSQMRAYEVEYRNLLSTQINYTPLILSLTQVEDRNNMVIANSIGKVDERLKEYGAILNTDLTY